MTNQNTAVEEVMEEENVDTSSSESSAESAESEVAESSQESETASTPEPEEITATAEAEEAEVEDPDSIHGLKAGQYLEGKVKNITNFGAFVDIGLPQDGLVHISELSRRKVDKVTDVVSVGQEIEVWVKKVDKKRGRISLTMIKPITRRLRDIKEGDEFEGVVTRLESYGAFVDIESDREGLVHISQITHDYINHPEEALSVGDKVRVKVLKVNRKKRQVDLSIKVLLPPPAPAAPEVVEEPEAVPVAQEESGDEPLPTAMALAYAAFQDEQESEDEDQDKGSQGKAKRQEEMDAIISRTLANRE